MLAASVLITLLAGWLLLGRFGSTIYVTDPGEQKSVRLQDGSIVHLNTSSRIEVSFSDTERVIRLDSGEALFAVKPDRNRPFFVLTDSARIRAVGTQFNVYRSSGAETRVAVIEGAVQVSSISGVGLFTASAREQAVGVQLKAGDEADVDRDRVLKVPKPNVERAVSWRARRLVFPGNPIGEIAAEFNRYSKRSIRVEGDELRAHRMSGVFDADDPSPMLRYLEQDPAIEVIQHGEEIVIRAKRSRATNSAEAH
jgi:transmembrane sensor